MNVLLVGNPGVGKSTLLNSLAKKAEFKAGTSIGHGLTFKLVEYTDPEFQVRFLDTPGLDDQDMREQAAEAITQALKKGGNYKVIFVVTLEAGRVKAMDKVTMNLVLEAASGMITQYGVVINKVEKKVLRCIEDNPDELQKLLTIIMDQVEPPTPNIFIAKYDPDLDDDGVNPLPPKFEEFVKELPFATVEAAKVKPVDPRSYEDMKGSMEAHLANLQRDRGALAEAMARLALVLNPKKVALSKLIEEHGDHLDGKIVGPGKDSKVIDDVSTGLKIKGQKWQTVALANNRFKLNNFGDDDGNAVERVLDISISFISRRLDVPIVANVLKVGSSVASIKGGAMSVVGSIKTDDDAEVVVMAWD